MRFTKTKALDLVVAMLALFAAATGSTATAATGSDAAAPAMGFTSAAAATGATAGAEAFAPLQMPTDPAEAMQYFEAEVDREDWERGPVSYIMLRNERDVWNDLENDNDRERFIAWFWDRRDADLRDRQNPFKEDFYTRVADANRRFAGFPRGWRSDRGQVWIVLGRPDNIKTDLATELEVWTYRTGRALASSSFQGEMPVYFAQVDTAKWEIFGGIGPGAWPTYVTRAFDTVNELQIENPDLEFRQ